MIKQINLITYALDNIYLLKMKMINKHSSKDTLTDANQLTDPRKTLSRGIKNDSAPSETNVSRFLI